MSIEFLNVPPKQYVVPKSSILNEYVPASSVTTPVYTTSSVVARSRLMSPKIDTFCSISAREIVSLFVSSLYLNVYLPPVAVNVEAPFHSDLYSYS